MRGTKLGSEEASGFMADFISSLPGPAKSSLASHLGVSLREVERWSSRAVQFRNYIPSRWWGSELSDLPQPILYRVFVAEAIDTGFWATMIGGGKAGQYLAGTAGIATAIILASRFRFGQTGDPFRDNATTGIELIQVGSWPNYRWQVVIDYEVQYDASSGDWGEREWDDDWDELGGSFF